MLFTVIKQPVIPKKLDISIYGKDINCIVTYFQVFIVFCEDITSKRFISNNCGLLFW